MDLQFVLFRICPDENVFSTAFGSILYFWCSDFSRCVFIIFIIVVFGLGVGRFPVLDDCELSVQYVTEYFVPASVLPVQTPQAMPILWVDLAFCLDFWLLFHSSFGLKQWTRNDIPVYYFPVSVFTVLSVPLIAFCLFV